MCISISLNKVHIYSVVLEYNYSEPPSTGESWLIVFNSFIIAIYSTNRYRNIKQILNGSKCKCAIYRMMKSDIGRIKAESNITFLNQINCILDELSYNICYIIYFYRYNLNLLMIIMLHWENVCHRTNS